MKSKGLVLSLAALVTCCLAFCASAAAETWRVPDDFAAIQDAIDSDDVLPGDTIRVAPGRHAGASVHKSVKIVGEGISIIDDGPMHPAGLSQGFRLLEGSDDTTISHLCFEVDLAIMNGARVGAVTVEHCIFAAAIQAISNWGGSAWKISHNVIIDLRTRNGGGIGILIADRSGGEVVGNVVSHNKITGTVYVHPADGGGYNAAGICIYADFRWGWPGAFLISENEVVKNKISLVSDTPDVVDVDGIELSENYYPNEHPGGAFVVVDNVIAFNDLRGTTSQMVVTPEGLEDENLITRNLGKNRGKGLRRPGFAIDPGGN